MAAPNNLPRHLQNQRLRSPRQILLRPAKPEDTVIDILGGLLGSQQSTAPAQDEENPEEKKKEEKKEDPTEKLLKGLFGSD